MFKLPIAMLLSVNGGYVDTMGFLALAGLFTAHVTGNFVTLGAVVAFGAGGAVAKLMALPLFCLSVLFARMASHYLEERNRPVVQVLLSAKLLLLSMAATFALAHGPFVDADGWATIAVGMVLVTAMAVQNAVHRAHMTKSPPTTLMTGTTTQIMIDLADLVSGKLPAETAALRTRLSSMSCSIFSFAIGCLSAAGAFLISSTWCFVVPPILVALALVSSGGKTRAQA